MFFFTFRVKEKAKKARSGKLMANWLKKAEKRSSDVKKEESNKIPKTE